MSHATMYLDQTIRTDSTVKAVFYHIVQSYVATKQYGIFTYMYHKNQPKVGKHTIDPPLPDVLGPSSPSCANQAARSCHLHFTFGSSSSLVKVSIKRDSLGEYFQHHTHTIHGTGIFPYMCHKHQPNVGKYTSPTDGRG